MDTAHTMKRLSNRAFGLALAALFIAFFGIAWLFFDVVRMWPVVLAILSCMIALLIPGVLLPLNRIWHLVAGWFGHVMNHVVLGIMYVALFIPTGMALRGLGRDPMQRERLPHRSSYWTDVQRRTNAETLHEMF